MYKLNQFIRFSLLMGFIIVLISCSVSEADENRPIVLADGGWESNKFFNEVARIIIEEGYGYEVEFMTGSTTARMLALKDGDIDAHLELWSENTGEIYFDGLAKGHYEKLALNFDDNFQGLYVPAYVIEGDAERGIEPLAPDLKYMEDLAQYWEVFRDPEDHDKGLIIGSISGWLADEILRDGIAEYGLDEYYNYLSPGSESSINVSLASAYEKGEPWIGYNYEPNWVMAKYDMIPILEKEENGPLESIGPQDIDIVANVDFVDRAPEVAEFFSNIQTSSDIANEALVFIQEEEVSAYDAAVKFLQEEEDLWMTWVPDDVANKVKAALD